MADPAAAIVIRDVLRELYGEDLPGELGRTRTDLVRIGTGRQDLSAADRAILGPRAARFPLIH